MDQFFLGAHDASESCREEILQRLETAFKLKASNDPVAVPGDEYKYLSDGTTLVSDLYNSTNSYRLLVRFEPIGDVSGRYAAKRLPPGDDFALGLQVLHWGMPPEIVKSVLPDLTFHDNVARQSYDYAGCMFDLSLSFIGAGLDMLSLHAVAQNPACRPQILQELKNTFPVLILTGRFARLVERRANHATSVFYYDDTRGSLNVEFGASLCQSIQVSIERVVAPASGTRPEVVPDADLGCIEYPPVSLRLLEGGSVGLDVHVLKDGSISLATIVAPDKSRRLNQAAVRIAATRLRFTPATVNGEAVESDVAVKVSFAVNHPIHGQP